MIYQVREKDGFLTLPIEADYFEISEDVARFYRRRATVALRTDADEMIAAVNMSVIGSIRRISVEPPQSGTIFSQKPDAGTIKTAENIKNFVGSGSGVLITTGDE